MGNIQSVENQYRTNIGNTATDSTLDDNGDDKKQQSSNRRNPPPRRRLSLTGLSGASYYPPAVAGVEDLPVLFPNSNITDIGIGYNKPLSSLSDSSKATTLPILIPKKRGDDNDHNNRDNLDISISKDHILDVNDSKDSDTDKSKDSYDDINDKNRGKTDVESLSSAQSPIPSKISTASISTSNSNNEIPPEIWTTIKSNIKNSAKIHHDFGPKGLAPLSSKNVKHPDSSFKISFPGHNKKGIIPIVLTWAKPAKSVYVTGTFSNWREKIRLTKSTNDFSTVVDMPPGTHQLKFIVNDEWQCSEDLPLVPDQDGHMVNVITVLDEAGRFQQDGLDDLARDKDYFYNQAMEDLALPPPYVERYDNEIGQRGRLKSRIQYTDANFCSDIPPYLLGKQPLPHDIPPLLPPQLTKVILNPSSKEKAVQPNTDILPPPTIVTLNHLYACSVRDGVMALGVTTRYRQKFITAIFYRPIFEADELAPTNDVSINEKGNEG